jgi:hypothetical protein
LATGGNRSAGLSRNIVDQWVAIKANPSGQQVKKLEQVVSSMKAFVGTSKHRFLFQTMEDDNYAPWFVMGMTYTPADKRSGVSAHVSINMGANNGLSGGSRGSRGSYGRGESTHSTTTITIHSHDFRGLTMGEILQKKGFFLETPEQFAKYELELEKYKDLHNEDGLQLSVIGKGMLIEGGWYERAFRPVEKAGVSAKMVIDPDDEATTSDSAIESPFWAGVDEDDDEEDEEDAKDAPLWDMPHQPYLRLFDLEEHANFRVHVNNVEVYKYNKEVGDKLVLPDDVRGILDVMVADAEDTFQDIVSGKEGGIIVLCDGPPGTGKTLTAEVYSEVMQKPLYKVQSSQLGISIQELEEQLKVVLQRSEKWGAILLIDEADVYVSARGSDIEQNAIVGIFLRVLEYYKGVLFMTTNRGTLVDDAIISRILATITYENPDEEQQTRLWRVLADQNNIELTNSTIPKLVSAFTNLSGRDIKNILKLAHTVAKVRNKPISVEMVRLIAKFSQTQEKKEEEA